MKKWILILIMLSGAVNAGELSISLGQKSLNNAEDIYSVNDWNGMQISYQPDNSNFYYFLSQEEAEVSPNYFVWTYSMTGLGIGTRKNISKNIRLFGQIGYYKIKNDFGKKRGLSEGLYYYLNRRWYGAGNQDEFHYFDEYEVINSDSFGGTIGVEILQPITEKITAGFSISHRLIKVKESITGYKDEWNYAKTGGAWRYSPNRDYSSTDFNINLNYKF